MISPIDNWVATQTSLHSHLNPDTLRRWQEEKLREVIDYARENTRFYRENLAGTHILKELPFTLPQEIARDPFAFLAVRQNQVARITTVADSGTTRLKKRVFFTEADLRRTRDFFSAGMSALVRPGDKAQILISNDLENSLGSLLKESLARIGVKSEISGELHSAREAVDTSRDADCLVGMPAELLYMSRLAPDLRPASVLLAGDIATGSVINRLKDTWKCEVFTHYGHTEFGYGCAVDCQVHTGLHLRDADLILEIIDPKTNQAADPGECGEIVITSLSNEAMPLIRYRTGNLSRWITDPCGCGSQLYRLSSIEGRLSDHIPIGNGQIISIQQLDELIFSNPVVRGFTAFLTSRTPSVLDLIMDSESSVDHELLKSQLPAGLSLRIDYGLADPFQQRGKRRIHLT